MPAPHNLQTVKGREALKPRRDPYFLKLSAGAFVGFRKMTASTAGTWVARWRDPVTEKQHQTSLGAFSDLPPSERYGAAKQAAEAWFKHLGSGGRTERVTVAQACEHYVEHLRATGGNAEDAEGRFNRYVLDNASFAALDLQRLTPAHVADWRKRLQAMPTPAGERRTPSTLNRDMTPFRAALNQALQDGLVATDLAWRTKLLPIENADRRRTLYLDRDQRKALVNAAGSDLATFMRGLCLLPLRPGALADLRVSQYDRRLRTLIVGTDKAGQDRALKLPEVTAQFFDECCKDKVGAARIFTRADGEAWIKDKWSCPTREAATLANLPAGTTLYTLRHSVISDLVHDGLDLLSTAQVAGTSVRMIEQHYGHLRGDVAASALARLAL